jgi:hypothetical protein
VKRDLKDWCITKELALDRREWKLVLSTPSWASSTSVGRKPRRKLKIADHIIIDRVVLNQDFPIVIREPHL